MKRRDGSKVIGLENSTTVEDQSGKVIGCQSTIKDISERMETERLIWKTNMQLLETNKKLKQTQSQLVHQEKLASIGQLAAGVAHEINNPLGFVKSNFSTLKEYLHSIKEYIQTVNESLASKIINNREKLLKSIRRVAATEKELDIGYIVDDIESIFTESEDGFERIVTIVQNLKNFSRVDSLGKVESYDLNKAIESTLTVARNEYKYIAEIEKHLSELPLIECVGSEINQVLLNIIVNAAQALESQNREGKGTVCISTRRVKDRVICEIADDGPGIPKHIQSQIFDPFFSTKETGKGTGLGLSISYDIVVSKHKGNLTVQSEKNKGTTFIIELPMRSELTEAENDENQE